MATGGLGLAQGFMQGYGFMDQLDKRERRMGLQEAQNQRSVETQDWQREQMGQQRDEWGRQDDGRLIQAIQKGVQTGNIDPKIAGEFGKRFDVDWSNYVSPEFGQSLEYLEGTVKGGNSMRSPEFNKAFETVFRSEINRGTGEEYDGEDGPHRVEQKRLAGVYPGQDGKTLMVDLDVLDRGPNGEQWRRAPVTDNRSAKDQSVKAIPLEQALDKLTGHKLMYQAVQNSPELQGMIQQYAARTGTQLPQAEKRYGEAFQHETLGWVQPGPDGELNQLDDQSANGPKLIRVIEREDGAYGVMADGSTRKLEGVPGKPGAARDGMPADVRTAEWMVSSGMAANMDEAWNRLSESRTDPTRFVADFVTQELKAQESAGIYPESEGFRTTDELRNQAIEVLKTIRQQTRSGPDNAAAPQEATRQVGMIEGGAVRQPNGSYAGQVDRTQIPPTIRKVRTTGSGGFPRPPKTAIEHLRNNPALAPQFQAKYGYLPEGS